MKNSLSATLRGILLLSIPASLGLVTLRVPIVALVLQRGQFDAHSTSLVAWALLFYGVGLVGHAMVEILARAFYALHDTKTPVMIGIVAMSLNVLFSYIFSAMFIRQGWMPHGGLALANSLATALESIVLILLMRKRLMGLEGTYIWQGVGTSILGTGLMAGVVIGWGALVGDGSRLLLVIGSLGLGLGAYLGLMWGLKVPELRGMVRVFVKRISRKKAGME